MKLGSAPCTSLLSVLWDHNLLLCSYNLIVDKRVFCLRSYVLYCVYNSSFVTIIMIFIQTSHDFWQWQFHWIWFIKFTFDLIYWSRYFQRLFFTIWSWADDLLTFPQTLSLSLTLSLWLTLTVTRGSTPWILCCLGSSGKRETLNRLISHSSAILWQLNPSSRSFCHPIFLTHWGGIRCRIIVMTEKKADDKKGK